MARRAAESEEESEDDAEVVGGLHRDSNIRSHETCTCRIGQGSSFVDSDQVVVEEGDDKNQSVASEERPEARVVSLRAPTCCRGGRMFLLLRRKRNKEGCDDATENIAPIA